jgi:hypothetical protein
MTDRPSNLSVLYNSSVPLQFVAMLPPATGPRNDTTRLNVGGQMSANVTFRFYRVLGVGPRYVASRGGTALTITGDNFFARAGDAMVRLRNASGGLVRSVTLPSFVGGPAVVVPMADLRSVMPAGDVTVDLSLNGGRQWSTAPGTVTLYADPYVSRTSPVSTPTTGNTVVTVTGYFPFTASLNATLGASQLPCVWVSEGLIRCVTPDSMPPGPAQLRVSVDPDSNNMLFTTDAVSMLYYPPPVVNFTVPPLLPRGLPDVFVVQGSVSTARPRSCTAA